MQQEVNVVNREITIDLAKIAKALVKKVWLILLIGVIVGGTVFVYENSVYVPQYRTSVTMFANTYSESNNSFSELIGTCAAVLETRMFQETVLTLADLDIPYSEFTGMITSSAISNSPLFYVAVTGTDTEEITLIANTIADVLPDLVAGVHEQYNVGVIDYASYPTLTTSNGAAQTACLAAGVGMLLVCGIIMLKVLFGDWKVSQEQKKILDCE